MSAQLWHGTKANLKVGDVLTPHYSNLVKKKVVYATSIKDWAILFGAKFGPGIECGILNNHPYITELDEDEFKTLKTPCYLYLVEGKFKTDKRLGLKDLELISDTSVKILKKYKVANVYNYIKRTKYFTLIDFDTRHKALEQCIKKLKK